MISDEPISYSCPYCERTGIETTATAPYVRGLLLAYQIGHKSFIGCASCVRGKVLKEVGCSCLFGWFSLTALIINPFLIIYNLVQTPFVRKDYAKARKKLREAGIPDHQSAVDVTSLGYSLAASMMAVDGRIDDSEIAAAVKYGEQLLPDFKAEALRGFIDTASELPAPQDIASLLREVLTEDGKKAVFAYLCLIARADGHVDDSEARLLADVAANMGFDPTTIDPG